MKLIGFKKINIEVLLKLIILIGFSFFFYDIIKTGKVLLYVTPRNIPYVKFGIIALVSLSLFIVRDLFKPKRNVNVKPYLFFVIPLFMAFMIPTTSVGSSSMVLVSAKSNLQINNTNKTNKTIVKNTTTPKTTSSKVSTQLKMHDNTIIVSDSNFVKWTDEISDNMVKYNGKKIVLTGFVFKAEGFKDNEFVPARLEMTCCAADLEPIGLLSHYAKAKDLKQDTWIIVTGKIKLIQYYGEKTPIIIVESIKDTVKPKVNYVYPFQN